MEGGYGVSSNNTVASSVGTSTTISCIDVGFGYDATESFIHMVVVVVAAAVVVVVVVLWYGLDRANG